MRLKVLVKFSKLLVCLVIAASSMAADTEAERLFKQGQKAEKAGEIARAYLLYQQAASLEPGNLVCWARSQGLRAVAAIESKQEVNQAPDSGRPFSPPVQPVIGTITPEEMAEARQPLPPTELVPPKPGKASFDLRGDARDIFEKVAAQYGLMVVFDRDYTSPPAFRFQISDVDYRDALRALEDISNSFIVPVSERIILVARETAPKRTELQNYAVQVVPIPARMTIQEAQEMATMVQQALDIRRITVDQQKRQILIRDQVTKVRTAKLILAQLAQYRPQVEIEVELMSADRTSSLNYGLTLPTSIPLTYFGNFLHAVPSIPTGFTQFLTFGGGSTLWGLGVSSVQAFASATKTNATQLLKSQIVSLDNQAASIHFGNKYPITTLSYIGAPTTQQISTPPPTVNFEELGLVLKVTPFVHSADEVTLEVSAEFKVLGSGSFNGIPVIAQRKFEGKVRLKTDELAIISGLVSTTETRTANGLLGLANLPLVGPMLRENTRDQENSDVLILLRPRVISLPASERVSKELWIGTETRPLTLF